VNDGKINGSPQWVMIFLFGVTALALAVGGYRFYHHQEHSVRDASYIQLKAIAELKVNQLVAWRQERLADARINSSGIVRLYVLQWLQERDADAALQAKILAHLQEYGELQGYENMILAGADGRMLLSLDPRLTALHPHAEQLVAEAVSSREAVFGDFFRCPVCSQVHLDVAASILDDENRPVAVLILRTNPQQYLYPLVQSWPTPSWSAETLLIHKEGEVVLLLNPLRHRSDPPLTLRIPLSQADVPAVQAAFGRTGQFEGRDYRGVEVLADIRPVPDSPWIMVAKVDVDEVLTEARYRGSLIGLLTLAVVLLTGLGMGFVYKHRTKRTFQALYRAERERREAQEEIRATLYGLGDGVIATDSAGRVTRMNPVAEALTGWREAQALGTPHTEVFRILNEETRAKVEDPVERVLREGKVVGLANHTLLIARDGSERPIADSGAPILNEKGEIAGVVLVFRDQTEERQYLYKLKASEKRFRQISSTISDLAYSCNTENGDVYVIDWMVGAAEKITGYSIDEIKTRRCWRFLVVDEDLPLFQEHIVGLPPGSTGSCELRIRNKSGEIVWLASVAQCVGQFDVPGRSVLYGALIDVTKRKLAEEALRDSEKWMKSVFRVAPTGIGVVKDRMIVDVNPRICEMTACSREELIGSSARIFYPAQEDYEYVGKEKYLQISRQGTGTVETRWIKKDGTIIDVLLSSTPIDLHDLSRGVTFTATDISKRKRAEEELRKLSMAVEQSPASVMIADLQGNIEYVNPRFTEVTGYTLDEVLGRNMGILRSGETSIEEYRTLLETITSGGEWHGVFHNKKKDGALFWERASISPIRDPSGAITHFIAVKEDITAQKTLEDQLRQAQKLESVGRLAGGVAHDFNNMLAVIMGRTEVAIMKADPSQPIFKDLQEILKAAQRSTDLVRQLLAFARQQTVAPRVMDLNEVVSGVTKMLQRLIGEEIDLIWNPGKDLWQVKIDASQVDQLLANLAVNARDAIAGVGSLTIETENMVLDEAYCANNAESAPGEYVLLAVSDNGCGMNRETLASIFEPFFTTKGPGCGTGLGLSTVYGIVKQNEGFINVYSEPDQGTTFKIYLPRFSAEPSGTLLEKEVRPVPVGTETVLLVEDEAAILDLGRIMLEGLGYTVVTAKAPGEALLFAAEHSGPIHLLITDVVMPEMNGRELAELLTAGRPGLKCLYMSGYTADIIAHRGVLDEGVNFVQKPFSMRDLAKKVREALGQE
jgi:two-component system, cell cycle sensor histidine kinase and response regulator CckA